jgi:hypothetical protein
MPPMREQRDAFALCGAKTKTGAPCRMFNHLFAFLEKSNDALESDAFTKKFVDNLSSFAFYDDLDESLRKSGSSIEYQTLFLPEPTAIDTFRAEVETAHVIYEMHIENAGFPVEYSEWDGSRWGIPRDWVVNETVKNMNGYGGFDGFQGGGYLSMEKWNDSHAEIINGKIYQPMTLPAGTYSFEANFSDERGGFNVSDEAYMAVVEGNTFPDIEDMPAKPESFF